MSEQPPDDRPPFDPLKWGFLLMSAVIGTALLIVLAGVGMCVVYGDDVMRGRMVCDKDSRLLELYQLALAQTLALVLAFINAFRDRGGGPPPDRK